MVTYRQAVGRGLRPELDPSAGIGVPTVAQAAVMANPGVQGPFRCERERLALEIDRIRRTGGIGRVVDEREAQKPALCPRILLLPGDQKVHFISRLRVGNQTCPNETP